MTLACVGAAHGASLDLNAYRGKFVYLDFWASWCTPCRQSFQWPDGLVNRYKMSDFVVIGVKVDQNRELATAYGVVGLPGAMLLDRAGHGRFQHVGFSERERTNMRHMSRVFSAGLWRTKLIRVLAAQLAFVLAAIAMAALGG